MLACRSRARRLAASYVFYASPARSTSTTAPTTTTTADSGSTSQPAEKVQDSIFTAPESPWDHVFSDIDPVPPRLSPGQKLHARSNDGTTPAPSAGRKQGQQSLVQRASLTAREMSVFDEMFDLIFNAVSEQGGKSSASGPRSGSSSPARTSPSAASHVSSSFPSQTPSIGRAGAPANDIFRTLRRHTSRMRWTTAIDEELDRKKETMELFGTDYELLQWITMELFGESQQWDEEAKKAIAASGARAAQTATLTDAASDSGSKRHPINHSLYPHLIAHAMRIFRTTYSNPSLSLAIFNHAARASIPSYVFGCTAPAYNELIEAKWEGWGDLEGVCGALEEMRANGVKIDGRTRMVVERVRREVGEARPEGETTRDCGSPLARRVWGELGEAETMELLHRIERLVLRDRSHKSSPHEESWKSAVLQPARDDDGWRFDGWEKEGRKRAFRR